MAATFVGIKGRFSRIFWKRETQRDRHWWKTKMNKYFSWEGFNWTGLINLQVEILFDCLDPPLVQHLAYNNDDDGDVDDVTKQHLTQ